VQVERRQHSRVSKRFDGTWRGASGATRCSISDISLSGCFVHGLSVPSKGEHTVVTVEFGPHNSLSFAGDVIYGEPGMGFAVRFRSIEQSDFQRLTQLLDELRAEIATP
jgi:PilZ domain-containing protein